ncbi:MAG: DUF370 domain-containing protein [Eubacteriales bacterium]|nr:DUF370 domain-containing protein [Eubacteriales bacterium]
MFLHLGKNESVREKEVVGIFDMETATLSRETRSFLKRMQNELKTVSLCDDIPKTFVLCDNSYTDTVYITQLSPGTTVKRSRRGVFSPTIQGEIQNR